ncbi:MAG TPA: PAS domain S-box protein [Stenomitos sp.]
METLDPTLLGTELEQARAEIRRLTELTHALMAAQGEMGYGAVIVDGQQVLYANDAFCELSGYTLEELIALPSFFNLVPDEERRVLQSRMAQRLMGEAVEDHYATAFYHRQGHLISLEAVVKAAHLDGRPHVIAMVRDVAL